MAAPVFTKVESPTERKLQRVMLYRCNIQAVLCQQSLQDLLASESQLVVLECRVKGSPSPRVDWYREGKIIKDSPDFRILQKSKLRCRDTEHCCLGILMRTKKIKRTL